MDAERVKAQELASFCHSMAVAGENVWNLNAFSQVATLDSVLEAADKSDHRRRREGSIKSIWDGIPVSFKANIAIQSQPLTAGSRILGEGYHHDQQRRHDSAADNVSPATSATPPPPCGYDAHVVRILLHEKGAVFIGVANMDEFGMGSLGTHLIPNADGTPRHTLNPLPLLHHLDWEKAVTSTGAGRILGSDDERLEQILQLPHDAILEAHHLALERMNDGGAPPHFFSAGGSSCGSAASVAHGSSIISLGTDTGGSVRLPAAWCGLVGLKPSYGLLSRHGIVSYASSFDTVGVLARSVDCATSALDVLAQRDTYSRDSTFSSYGLDKASEIATAQMMATEEPSSFLKGVRVGVPHSFVFEECPEEVLEAWSRAAEWLQRHGAEIVEVSTDDLSLDLVQLALSAYYVLVSAEASSNLSRYDGFRYGVNGNDENAGNHSFAEVDSDFTPLEEQYAATRRRGFGVEVARRILCGTSVLSSDRFHTHYEAAAKLRAALADELNFLLDEHVDLVLIPTVASIEPQSIDPSTSTDNTAVFATDVLTVPASLCGLPAISVPVPGVSSCDPFLPGMQLVGSRLREDVVLKAAKILESIDCSTV